MPELDYAILGDYVRTEGGIGHIIAAGIDAIYTPAVPTGQNVGLLLRVTFARNECERPHRLEIIFQGEDGERHTHITSTIEPVWDEELWPGWRVGAIFGINMGIPLPQFGTYSFEILLNDNLVKAIPIRVIERGSAPPGFPPELSDGDDD